VLAAFGFSIHNTLTMLGIGAGVVCWWMIAMLCSKKCRTHHWKTGNIGSAGSGHAASEWTDHRCLDRHRCGLFSVSWPMAVFSGLRRGVIYKQFSNHIISSMTSVGVVALTLTAVALCVAASRQGSHEEAASGSLACSTAVLTKRWAGTPARGRLAVRPSGGSAGLIWHHRLGWVFLCSSARPAGFFACPEDQGTLFTLVASPTGPRRSARSRFISNRSKLLSWKTEGMTSVESVCLAWWLQLCGLKGQNLVGLCAAKRLGRNAPRRRQSVQAVAVGRLVAFSQIQDRHGVSHRAALGPASLACIRLRFLILQGQRGQKPRAIASEARNQLLGHGKRKARSSPLPAQRVRGAAQFNLDIGTWPPCRGDGECQPPRMWARLLHRLGGSLCE